MLFHSTSTLLLTMLLLRTSLSFAPTHGLCRALSSRLLSSPTPVDGMLDIDVVGGVTKIKDLKVGMEVKVGGEFEEGVTTRA